MPLDDAQKAERRGLLAEALVPERFFNVPLSKQGAQGTLLREYTKTDYGSDAAEGRGAIILNNKPGLANSFTRDIVIMGASVNVYYLQTFANKFTSNEFVMPQSFVIEWFEQDGTTSPFTPSERYRIETAVSQMVDDGLLFYMFTSVHPNVSQWWSKNFIELLLDNCRLIEVKNAVERGDKGTAIRPRKAQGQENTKTSSRVVIR